MKLVDDVLEKLEDKDIEGAQEIGFSVRLLPHLIGVFVFFLVVVILNCTPFVPWFFTYGSFLSNMLFTARAALTNILGIYAALTLFFFLLISARAIYRFVAIEKVTSINL